MTKIQNQEAIKSYKQVTREYLDSKAVAMISNNDQGKRNIESVERDIIRLNSQINGSKNGQIINLSHHIKNSYKKGFPYLVKYHDFINQDMMLNIEKAEIFEDLEKEYHNDSKEIRYLVAVKKLQERFSSDKTDDGLSEFREKYPETVIYCEKKIEIKKYEFFEGPVTKLMSKDVAENTAEKASMAVLEKAAKEAAEKAAEKVRTIEKERCGKAAVQRWGMSLVHPIVDTMSEKQYVSSSDHQLFHSSVDTMSEKQYVSSSDHQLFHSSVYSK